MQAEAHLQVMRVMQIKTALIERMITHGDFDHSKCFQSKREERQWFKANFAWIRGRGSQPTWPAVIDSPATISPEKLDQSAEAVRRLLPEFARLHRYENRAAGRRDRAIRQMMRVGAKKS
jgi:hypothetical protein